MTLHKNFSSMALFSFLAACAGSVETIDGENGDGDDSPQGDGDYYGDGTIPLKEMATTTATETTSAMEMWSDLQE